MLAVDAAPMLFEVGACRLRSGGALGILPHATSSAGECTWALPIPNAPVLLGLHVVTQALLQDWAALGSGVAASAALGCVVGAP